MYFLVTGSFPVKGSSVAEAHRRASTRRTRAAPRRTTRSAVSVRLHRRAGARSRSRPPFRVRRRDWKARSPGNQSSQFHSQSQASERRSKRLLLGRVACSLEPLSSDGSRAVVRHVPCACIPIWPQAPRITCPWEPSRFSVRHLLAGRRGILACSPALAHSSHTTHSFRPECVG